MADIYVLATKEFFSEDNDQVCVIPLLGGKATSILVLCRDQFWEFTLLVSCCSSWLLLKKLPKLIGTECRNRYVRYSWLWWLSFQVCLSNQVLFNEISAAGKRIASGGAMTDKGKWLARCHDNVARTQYFSYPLKQLYWYVIHWIADGHVWMFQLPISDCSLLLKARSDLDVASNGLEPLFMKFMAKCPTQPSAVACILSILWPVTRWTLIYKLTSQVTNCLIYFKISIGWGA